MSTATKNGKSQLEILAEEAEQARAALATAQAAVEAENQAAEQRRAEAHANFDRRTVDEFDVALYDAEVEAARAALVEAVLADPVRQAIIRVDLAEYARGRAAGDVVSAAHRLGLEPPQVYTGVTPVGPDELERIVEAEVGRRVADVLDARDQARVDVGERAAKRRTRRGRGTRPGHHSTTPTNDR